MKFLAISLVLISSLFFAAPSQAQNLGLWGGWNDHGNGWQERGPKRSRYSRGYDPYDSSTPFPELMGGGPRPDIRPKAPPVVAFLNQETPGTILIDTDGRRLYFTLNRHEAYIYPISVGRDGFAWSGSEAISRIALWPDWHPPKEMLARDPRLPVKMTGGLKNPLGAVAIYLGKTLYRIHGTNDRATIGQAASSGCFRMLNEHALHLAALAEVGTVVKVMPSLDARDNISSFPENKAQRGREG